VEDNFEAFEQVYDERFERRYGFWRPYVGDVIRRFLDCGVLYNGFARMRCEKCGHEYLLAFSCKRRHFCPSCHQKRVVEFGEWLCGHVIKAVPHRHLVFGIPKILRRCFLYNRKLLSGLSRCAWEAVQSYLRSACPSVETSPAAVNAIQTFGDFLNFNPHCHMLVADGGFHASGMFRVAPKLDGVQIAALFRQRVLRLLLSEGRITEDLVALMDRWRHTGFNVYCGPRILPWQARSMENLACYIIRASFSQERMTYVRESGQVVYRSKDGGREKVFDALEWMAAMCSHIPDRGEQMVRYYGYYSNVSRGKRRKAGRGDEIECILEPELSDGEFRKSWARLIRKVYEVDPLVCPRCAGPMRVIAFIEDEVVIKKILVHLGRWEVKRHLPPVAHGPPLWDEVDTAPTANDYLTDPQYPAEAYF